MFSNTRLRTTRDVDSMAVITRWIRRCALPFAILAWTGVALLILWLAGHMIQTLLLLTFAALLAYVLTGSLWTWEFPLLHSHQPMYSWE